MSCPEQAFAVLRCAADRVGPSFMTVPRAWSQANYGRSARQRGRLRHIPDAVFSP